MLQQFYDVCVLGEEAAGLLAGALLARRGCRVALVGTARPVAPPAHHLELGGPKQLDALPHIRRIHQELGLPRPPLQGARPSPTWQLVEARHRLDMHGFADLEAELCREFPADRAAMRHFCAELPRLDAAIGERLARRPLRRRRGFLTARVPRLRGAAHLLQPFSAHPLWSDLPMRHPWRRLIGSCLALHGAVHPTAYAAIRLLMQLWRGDQLITAALPSLSAQLLRDAAQRHGADGYTLAEPAHAEMRRGKLLGLQTDRGLLRAATFIDGLDTPLSRHLPAAPAAGPLADWWRRFVAPPQEQLAACEAASRPTHALWETALEVGREALPEAMASCVVMAPRASGEQALRIHVAGGAAPDACRLTLRCLSQNGQPPGPAALRAIQRQVAHLLPFYAQHVAQKGDRPWRWQRLGHGVHAAPVEPLSGLRAMRGSIKNVWHCGPAVLPELGREATYLVGAHIAERLAG